MWLQCIGVVSGCCFKEVYRFPNWQAEASPPLSVELSEFSLYLFIYLCLYMYIYFRLYVVHVPLTRNA